MNDKAPSGDKAGLAEAAAAAYVDFVYEHGSDFDGTKWPGMALLRSFLDGAAVHEPGDSHRYRLVCAVCGQFGTIRVTVDPERDGASAALAAGTHEPAVDDFGNQYLAPRRTETPRETAAREKRDGL